MHIHEYALLLRICINGSMHALGSLNSVPETELSLWKLNLSVFPIWVETTLTWLILQLSFFMFIGIWIVKQKPSERKTFWVWQQLSNFSHVVCSSDSFRHNVHSSHTHHQDSNQVIYILPEVSTPIDNKGKDNDEDNSWIAQFHSDMHYKWAKNEKNHKTK